MGSTGKLLGTSVVLGRNLRRNAMDVRRVDILHVQIVELAVLGLTDLDNRQGAHVILAVYADGDLGTLDTLLDQHFVAKLKRLGDSRRQLGGLVDQGNAIAGTVDGRFHKATLATDLDNVIDIDFIAHFERKAGGNGNARLGV